MTKMAKKSKTLAIIPARGGSKGIPRKNIKPFLGKPLIAYTIEIALKSKLIDKVIVSTDDEEIAEIAKKYGVEVPFLRPKELATDTSPVIETLRHATKFFEERGIFFDNIVVLEPTAPLRDIQDVEIAIERLNEDDVDTVVGACKFEIDFSDIMVLKENGYIKPFLDVEKLTYRRQNTKNIVKLNAAVYAAKRDVIMDPKTKILNPYGENDYLRTKIVLMPEERSIEIDKLIDFEFAEFLMKRKVEYNKKYKK